MDKIKKFFAVKKRRVISIVLIVVVLIGAIAFSLIKSRNANNNFDDMEITADMLSLQDLSEAVNVTGVVESQNILAVSSELEMKVEELNVALGDRVNVGDVLCTFNAEDIKRQIDSINTQNAQALKLDEYNKRIMAEDLNIARAQRDSSVNEAQNAHNIAVAEYNAYTDALKRKYGVGEINVGALAEEEKTELDYKKSLMDSTKEALTSAIQNGDAAILSAQRALEQANIQTVDNTETNKVLSDLKSQLDKTSLIAGQSGVITQLNIQKGGMPAGTIMQIEDDTNLRVSVSVREQDIIKLREGMDAVVTSEAFPGEEFSGKVSQVINFASSQSQASGGEAMGQGASGYSAIVDLDPGTPLLLGMSVKVAIKSNQLGEALSVPYDAIMDDGDGQTYVFRANPTDGSAYDIEKIFVTTGEGNDYYTSVESEELFEGDYIITTPWLVQDKDRTEVFISTDAFLNDEGIFEEGM